ncbi:MAG: terminase, partial [Desulfobulbia bacterium]
NVLAALPERERLAYREGRFDLAIQDELNQAIPTSWIRLAQERWKENPPGGIPMCSMGVDMTGGSRDPMIISRRYDTWFAPLIEIPASEFDVATLSQQAAAQILTHRRDQSLVILDVGGGYGSGTYENLKQNNIEVHPYKGSQAAVGVSRDSKIPFQNTRSAAIWRFREALDPGQPGGSQIAIPDDPELVADLTGPTYRIENHVIKIESKEKLVERLGRSTDKGDAVIMAWYKGPRMTTNALEFIDKKMNYQSRGRQPKVIMSKPRQRRYHA